MLDRESNSEEEVSEEEVSEEVSEPKKVSEQLIINFFNQDGDIKYAIDEYDKGGTFIGKRGIFIGKDGTLGKSITGDLTESLKNKTTMLGIYENYLNQIEQNKLYTKVKNAASSVSQTASRVKQGFNTAYITPIKEGLKKSDLSFMNPANYWKQKGGKTKSKRSYNANKTLKNRK